ncbi:MAG: putative prophage LambdaCh01, head morphosis protein family [Schlesneria sp.]|nr:putative prophage LambdaCh01, head morphosis protein family [Schlesneria sp.]
MNVGTRLQRHGLNDDEIIRLFKNAEKQVIDIIERADPNRPFAVYRTSHLREIELIILQLERKLGRETTRTIDTVYSAGATETADAIKAMDEKQFKFSFSGVNQEAVAVLTGGALAEYGTTIRAIRANGAKALFDKKKLNDRIIEGVIQGSSVSRTTSQLVQSFKRDGITALVTSNGRNLKVEPYSNTLVRSQTMSAYNLGAKATMLDSGRRFAKIAKLRPDLDGPDICNKFEDQVYIDLKDPTQLPPYHPNCRHVLIPVSFAELKANRPDLYKSALNYFQN